MVNDVYGMQPTRLMPSSGANDWLSSSSQVPIAGVLSILLLITEDVLSVI